MPHKIQQLHHFIISNLRNLEEKEKQTSRKRHITAVLNDLNPNIECIRLLIK